MGRDWYLFSRQGLVLVALIIYGDLTVEEIARRTTFSRWTVLRALRDLRDAGMVRTARQSTRNVYQINADAEFLNPLLRGRKIGVLVSAFRRGDGPEGPK